MMRLAAAMLVLGVATTGVMAADSGPSAGRDLRAPSEFQHIENDEQRARALFEEIGRVIGHPRCVNCHPRTERPLQGEHGALHQPLVVRGAGGMGRPGMLCNTCHLTQNFRNVPGNPKWLLAPASMTWEGVTLGGICEQIKDPERNGGRTLEALGRHAAEDVLVAYGWNPPAHLEPVPGTQEAFGELVRAWIDAGAHCPGG